MDKRYKTLSVPEQLVLRVQAVEDVLAHQDWTLQQSVRHLKRKRPPNALLARGWIQVQAVVGAAGCQRWGSREEMSACLVVGRRVMTSRRYA